VGNHEIAGKAEMDVDIPVLTTKEPLCVQWAQDDN